MKSVADWLQRGYTEAVLMETGMRRNKCMKRLSKVSCGLLLTASLLIGAMLSGCGQTTDYTAEIKEYQNKLESLAAERRIKGAAGHYRDPEHRREPDCCRDRKSVSGDGV